MAVFFAAKRPDASVSQERMTGADITGCEHPVLAILLTQVSTKDFASGNAVKGVGQEPQEFLSGQFKGAQLQLPTLVKESYVTAGGFKQRVLDFRGSGHL